MTTPTEPTVLIGCLIIAPTVGGLVLRFPLRSPIMWVAHRMGRRNMPTRVFGLETMPFQCSLILANIHLAAELLVVWPYRESVLGTSTEQLLMFSWMTGGVIAAFAHYPAFRRYWDRRG